MAAEIHDYNLYRDVADLKEQMASLQTAKMDGIQGKMDTPAERELNDQKIAASEARSETKMARLEGKLDLLANSISNLSGKIDTQRSEASSNRNLIIATVVASALAVVGLGYAALSYGATTFANGTIVRDLIHNEAAQSAKPTSSK